MARLYWIKAGRQIVWRDTVKPSLEFVQRLANRAGRALTVGYDDLAGRALRRNPDPGAFLDTWLLQLDERARRASRTAAQKPRRLAKHDRPRKSSSSKSSSSKSSAGQKSSADTAPASTGSGRFLVKAKRGKTAYELTRASRPAAEDLARQFAAEGYRATVQEI